MSNEFSTTFLDFLNTKIREEHGNRVTLDSDWMDAEVDSFGTTVVFLELDDKYGCFDKEWLKTVDWMTLTIADLHERAKNANPQL